MPKCPFCRLHTDTGSELQDHIDIKHPEEATDVGAFRRTQTKRIQKTTKKPLVIDGNSILSVDGKPKVILIKKLRSALHKEGFSPIIYVTSKVGKKIDEPNEYNRLKNLRWIIEVEDLPQALTKMAIKKKCAILTNNNYSSYAKEVDTEDWKMEDVLLKFSYNDGLFVLA